MRSLLNDNLWGDNLCLLFRICFRRIIMSSKLFLLARNSLLGNVSKCSIHSSSVLTAKVAVVSCHCKNLMLGQILDVHSTFVRRIVKDKNNFLNVDIALLINFISCLHYFILVTSFNILDISHMATLFCFDFWSNYLF